MLENTYGTSNSHFHIFIASANTIQTVRVVEHLRPIKVPVILIKIVTLPALRKDTGLPAALQRGLSH